MLALMQTEAPPGQAGTGQTMIADAAASAREALSLDPKEPSALLAVYDLEGSTLDWFQRDQRLRSIIALGPKHVPAINQLVALLQSAGLNREFWDWNERAIRIEPQSPELLCRRALKLWIARRTDEADKVIDQARDTWPADPFVWWVRFPAPGDDRASRGGSDDARQRSEAAAAAVAGAVAGIPARDDLPDAREPRPGAKGLHPCGPVGRRTCDPGGHEFPGPRSGGSGVRHL